jgi:hypothetical protein
MTIAGCGSSGAAVATAAAGLGESAAALSAGLGESAAAGGAPDWGAAVAEVSAFWLHALKATAAQSAKTVKSLWIMMNIHFTSVRVRHKPFRSEED